MLEYFSILVQPLEPTELVRKRLQELAGALTSLLLPVGPEIPTDELVQRPSSAAQTFVTTLFCS